MPVPDEKRNEKISLHIHEWQYLQTVISFHIMSNFPKQCNLRNFDGYHLVGLILGM